MDYQRKVEEKQRIIVGVTEFVKENEQIDIPILEIGPETEQIQVEKLNQLKAERDNQEVEKCLEEIEQKLKKLKLILDLI